MRQFYEEWVEVFENRSSVMSEISEQDIMSFNYVN